MLSKTLKIKKLKQNVSDLSKTSRKLNKPYFNRNIIKIKKKRLKTHSVIKNLDKLLNKKNKFTVPTLKFKNKTIVSMKVKNINSKSKNRKYRRYKKSLKLNTILRQLNNANSCLKSVFTTKILHKNPLKVKKIRTKKESIKMLTKSNQTFVLRSPIMFFKQFFLKHSLKTSIQKFIFKKTIFSFFKLNEVRRNLMNLKKKFFFYNLIFREKLLRQKNTHFRPSKLKEVYKISTYYNCINQKLKKNTVFEKSQYSFVSKTASLDIASKNVFDLKGIDFTLKRPEVKIPRVRFKPGYRRI